MITTPHDIGAVDGQEEHPTVPRVQLAPGAVHTLRNATGAQTAAGLAAAIGVDVITFRAIVDGSQAPSPAFIAGFVAATNQSINEAFTIPSKE